MFPGNYAMLYLTVVVATADCSQDGSSVSQADADVRELILEDNVLNVTKDEAWDSIHKFFSSGNEKQGLSALQNTQMYVDRRRNWLESMLALSLNNDILADGTWIENRYQELNSTENIFHAVSNIYQISFNYDVLENLNKRFCNLSVEFNDTYESEIGMESIKVTKEYLKHLEIVDRSVAVLRNSPLQGENTTLVVIWISNFPNLQECQIFLNITRQSLLDQETLLERIDAYLFFRDYIDPPVYILVLLTGLVWNIALLLMFAQKKEIRTPPNIMIFNIVIADVLNLTFNLPLQYFGAYYPSYVRLSEPVCILFISLRCMFTSASALSVVALSAQRFCATLPAFHNLKARCHLTSLVITIAYILFIWAAASCIVLPDTLLEKVCDDTHNGKSGRKSAKVVSLHEFLIYCFALPGIMFLFTILTATRLRKSAKDIPGDIRHKTHEDARNRGATVVTALCIVFTISYVPFFLWGRIATTLELDRWKLGYRILDNITYYLLFSNPCFNPLALYVTSKTFRRLFNGYLCGWCMKRHLQRTDTQISYDNTTQSSRQQESDI